MEQWRPRGDRLAFADVAWTGSAYGLAMHAVLRFFSVGIPSLERLLVVFAPAERFAYALTSGTNPSRRWLVLLASQAVFWPVAGVGLLALVHEVAALVRRTRPT